MIVAAVAERRRSSSAWPGPPSVGDRPTPRRRRFAAGATAGGAASSRRRPRRRRGLGSRRGVGRRAAGVVEPSAALRRVGLRSLLRCGLLRRSARARTGATRDDGEGAYAVWRIERLMSRRALLASRGRSCDWRGLAGDRCDASGDATHEAPRALGTRLESGPHA